MREDENFTLLILEHIERSIRGISRLFRILVSRITENSGDQISDQLAALASKLDDNSRILQEIKEKTAELDKHKKELSLLSTSNK